MKQFDSSEAEVTTPVKNVKNEVLIVEQGEDSGTKKSLIDEFSTTKMPKQKRVLRKRRIDHEAYVIDELHWGFYLFICLFIFCG